MWMTFWVWQPMASIKDQLAIRVGATNDILSVEHIISSRQDVAEQPVIQYAPGGL